MFPPPGSPRHRPPRSAAAALLAAAPLVTRWTERLLGELEPRLTLSQYLALRAIADEPLGATELAHRTGVSGPAVSQLLSTLVDAGWVGRASVSGDRRRHELSLTAGGHAVLQALDGLLITRLAELIATSPRPELDALAHALPSIRAAMAGTPPPRRRPRPPPPGSPGSIGPPEPAGQLPRPPRPAP